MSDIEEPETKAKSRPKRQDKRKETSKNNIKKAIEARKMRLKEQRDNRKDKEAEDQVKFIEEDEEETEYEEEESSKPDRKEFTQEEIEKLQKYYEQNLPEEEEEEYEEEDYEEEEPTPKPKRQPRKKVVNIKPPKLRRGRKTKIQQEEYDAQPSRLVEEVGEMRKIIQDMKIAKERQKQRKRLQVLSSKRAQKQPATETKPVEQSSMSIEELRKNLFKNL